jgi:DNA-binding MarR family transcriptional regulator
VETAMYDDLAGEAIPAALAGYTGSLVRRACARTRRIMQAAMPANAQPRDYAILGLLAERDATSQQDLAARLNINRTVMVKLIDRLEAAGQVVRTRNPADRRLYMLSLTEEGRRARAEMLPAIAQGEAQLGAPLTPDERVRLGELLRRLLPDLDDNLPHPPGQRTGYLLVQADLWLGRRNDQALADVGIQMRHFSALATLEQIGPCTQQELAGRLGTTETAMVQVVDDLQDGKLAERGRDPHDRRRYALRLTDPGRAKLAEAERAVAAVQAEVAELIGPDEDKELRSLLAKLV